MDQGTRLIVLEPLHFRSQAPGTGFEAGEFWIGFRQFTEVRNHFLYGVPNIANIGFITDEQELRQPDRFMIARSFGYRTFALAVIHRLVAAYDKLRAIFRGDVEQVTAINRFIEAAIAR